MNSTLTLTVTSPILDMNDTDLNVSTNVTSTPLEANCTKAVLNAVIPIICVLVFMGTVVVTYFVDDPGLRKLKRSTDKVETTADTTAISEVDRNYIRYLAEHRMVDHVKGHTFSSFSPSYAPQGIPLESIPDRRHPRRRACSESHTGRRFSDASSETQVILEQMLLTIGSGSTYTSLRHKSNFQLPFTHRRSKHDTKPTESLTAKKGEHKPAEHDEDDTDESEEHQKEYDA